MLHLYNTLTRLKEKFTPIRPGEATIYSCGVTAYDFCHLGHARTFTCFDLLVRYLQYSGFTVRFVRNITDIDDKIIQKSATTGQACPALVAEMVEAMHEDFDALGLLRPTISPYATQHLPEMIALIERLLEQSMAYQALSGDVLFSVKTFARYGSLSQQPLDQLRCTLDSEDKRDPLDFVLWKRAKPQEPSWPSPWGEGRPGWHIECSAMSRKWLGDHFDIHGGGSDLMFPHHENEIAQSVSAYHCAFANLWMHIGMVSIAQEKMSKSLNNFLTIRSLLQKYPAEVLRYFLLCAHYRSQLVYSEEALEQAAASLDTLYGALEGTRCVESNDEVFEARFCAALDDDLNTPQAYAVLFELAGRVNTLKKEGSEAQHSAASTLRRLAGVLGLLQQDPKHYFQNTRLLDAQTRQVIEGLIAQRQQARRDKDWVRADVLKAALLNYPIELQDRETETVWRGRQSDVERKK